jgi:hypothetical protein
LLDFEGNPNAFMESREHALGMVALGNIRAKVTTFLEPSFGTRNLFVACGCKFPESSCSVPIYFAITGGSDSSDSTWPTRALARACDDDALGWTATELVCPSMMSKKKRSGRTNQNSVV